MRPKDGTGPVFERPTEVSVRVYIRIICVCTRNLLVLHHVSLLDQLQAMISIVHYYWLIRVLFRVVEGRQFFVCILLCRCHNIDKEATLFYG